jgi:hypothetical protein
MIRGKDIAKQNLLIEEALVASSKSLSLFSPL